MKGGGKVFKRPTDTTVLCTVEEFAFIEHYLTGIPAKKASTMPEMAHQEAREQLVLFH